MSDVTQMLREIRLGAGRTSEDLLPLVYDELRHIAGARMARESAGQTLQPTALVHEAWLRLVGDGDRNWENRAHFFGAAAEAMRKCQWRKLELDLGHYDPKFASARGYVDGFLRRLTHAQLAGGSHWLAVAITNERTRRRIGDKLVRYAGGNDDKFRHVARGFQPGKRILPVDFSLMPFSLLDFPA